MGSHRELLLFLFSSKSDNQKWSQVWIKHWISEDEPQKSLEGTVRGVCKRGNLLNSLIPGSRQLHQRPRTKFIVEANSNRQNLHFTSLRAINSNSNMWYLNNDDHWDDNRKKSEALNNFDDRQIQFESYLKRYQNLHTQMDSARFRQSQHIELDQQKKKWNNVLISFAMWHGKSTVRLNTYRILRLTWQWSHLSKKFTTVKIFKTLGREKVKQSVFFSCF